MDDTNENKSEQPIIPTKVSLGISLAASIMIYAMSCHNNKIYTTDIEKKTAQIEQLCPKNITVRDVNNDSLQDLIYKTGEIYLQQKDGQFISYDSLVKQEKANIDAKYKITQDSIMNQYRK
jgi:hypothetical protein